MHEMSLCQALISTALRELEQHPGLAIKRLKVSVGALSGCEASLLTPLFPHAAAGSSLAQSELEIEEQAAVVRCTACGTESAVQPNKLLCSACASPAVQIIAGDGVFLTNLVLRKEEHV